MRKFAPEVFGLCLAIVGDRSQAEDLSQEVFASAFSALPGFRGEASARTWILKIARNGCIDHLRKRKRWSGLDDDGDPDEFAEDVSLPNTILSRRSDIELALVGLEEVERALIVLRFSHGLDYEELAAAFGLKSGTTRMRVSRALAKMRDYLVRSVAPPPAQAHAQGVDFAAEFAEDAAPTLVTPESHYDKETASYPVQEDDEESMPAASRSAPPAPQQSISPPASPPPVSAPRGVPPAAGVPGSAPPAPSAPSAPPALGAPPKRPAPSAPPPPQSAPSRSRRPMAAAPPPAPVASSDSGPPRHVLNTYFESEETWLSIELQVRLRDMAEGLRTS